MTTVQFEPSFVDNGYWVSRPSTTANPATTDSSEVRREHQALELLAAMHDDLADA